MNNYMEHGTDDRLKGNFAMYLRKSRADVEAEKLGEGETLARHKHILENLAARKGIHVEKIYHEIVSGETIAARPQIQELIKDCYAGKYRGIIIIDVDRLSRGNQGDMQTIMDCLKFSNNRNGLIVVTPTKVYDVSHNPDDEEYMEFVLFMSRREYKTIQKRLERGRRQAVVEGNYMGSYRPYGYDILKNKAGRTLIQREDEAPIVKKIYDWTIKENLTPGKIARRLDAMGVPTYTGEPEWSIATVKTILTNPTYYGKVRWNDRMKVKTMVNGELVVSRPRSNHTEHYMLYEGKHKGIITEEEFKEAGKRFYSDKTKANLTLKNPLAGLLVCKNCGRAMVYQSHEKRGIKPRYNHTQSKLCKVKSVIVEDVINAVVHSLRLYIEDFEVKANNIPQIDENALNEQIKALHAEQKKIERRMSRLFDAWEDETITNNEFVQRKKVNTERIENIKREIEALENTVPEKEEYEERIMRLSDALDALLNPDIEAEEKNMYLKNIIERIEYSRENRDEFILDITLKD